MRIYASNWLKDTQKIPINADESNIMLFDRDFINPWESIDRMSFAYIIFSYYMVAYVTWEYKSHVAEIFKVAMDDRRKWIELYIQSAIQQRTQLETVIEKLQYIPEDVNLPTEYKDDLERYGKTFLTSFNAFDTDLIVYKNKKYGPI
jgi:predicted RNase H-like HicB family nuclease